MFKALRQGGFKVTNKKIVQEIVHLVLDPLTVIVDIHTARTGFLVKVTDINIKVDIINLVSIMKKEFLLTRMRD